MRKKSTPAAPAAKKEIFFVLLNHGTADDRDVSLLESERSPYGPREFATTEAAVNAAQKEINNSDSYSGDASSAIIAKAVIAIRPMVAPIEVKEL